MTPDDNWSFRDAKSKDLTPSPFPRLYAILDVEACEARRLRPLDLLDLWLGEGVRLVQLRAKRMSSGALLELADAVAAGARAAGATFILNDRADLARLCAADGVHVGQDDLAPRDVRRLVGLDALVGLSTHDASQASAALSEPISYLAIGPVFTTQSKGPRVDPAVGLDGVRDAARLAGGARMPLVAIGGVTPDSAAGVLAAGAASVAVIAGLLDDDPAVQVRRFLRAVR
jgi:thiamine-phosphate pyrophosphorylase